MEAINEDGQASDGLPNWQTFASMKDNFAYLPQEGPGPFTANPATKPPISDMDSEAAGASALATFFYDHMLDMTMDHERKLGIIHTQRIR